MSTDSADTDIKVTILEFSSGARWLTPTPVKVKNYYWSYLTAGGLADIGEAFRNSEAHWRIYSMGWGRTWQN